MRKFEYTVDLNGLTVVKTKDEQYKNFFYSGHPCFLIPDFGYDTPQDIWIIFIDFLEKIRGEDIYNQDGGEIESYTIVNEETGLTKCKYTAYDIVFNEDDDESVDIEVDIEGYVVTDKDDLTYFLATKVIEHSLC